MLRFFDKAEYFWQQNNTMAIIALEGMRFNAPHGYYPEEQVLGNEFILDVLVSTNFLVAAITDELYEEAEEDDEEEEMETSPNTVNYETLYLICQMEMRKPTKLLETLVNRIADRISKHFDEVTGLVVRLRKLNPPLGGRVDSAWVLTSRGDLDASYLS
jgi:dihydroneopterin aldolase